MRIAILAATWIAAQLSAGLVVVVLAGSWIRRRRDPIDPTVLGALLPAILTTAVLAVLCAAVWGALPVPGVNGTERAALWTHALLGSGAVAGCYLLVFAGYLESRGLLRAARRTARRAGWLVAGSCLLQAVPGALLLAARWTGTGTSPAAGLPFLAGSLLLGLTAGAAALLAGLSGKARPTSYAVVLLIVVATLAWLAGAL